MYSLGMKKCSGVTYHWKGLKEEANDEYFKFLPKEDEHMLTASPKF